jgi:hypothetical protein
MHVHVGRGIADCVSEAMRLRRLGAAVAMLASFACDKSASARPEGVPAGAAFVNGGKVGGWWQECIPAIGERNVRCHIWNGAGLVLVDEFLPYDGGPPPIGGELRILPDPTFPGPDRIILTNSRVLLPKSRFEELKKFVDWLNGKSSSPTQ